MRTHLVRAPQMDGVVVVAADEMRSAVRALASGADLTLPGAPLASVAPVGEGGYATVYSAALAAECPCGHAGAAVALKVTALASVWEFYVQRELAARVPPRSRAAYLPALAMYVGSDHAGGASPARAGLRAKSARGGAGGAVDIGHGGVLVMPLGRHGTVLDLANAHLVAGAPLGDSLMLYIALQLLQVRRCRRTNLIKRFCLHV
jgi:hypothetical protein